MTIQAWKMVFNQWVGKTVSIKQQTKTTVSSYAANFYICHQCTNIRNPEKQIHMTTYQRLIWVSETHDTTVQIHMWSGKKWQHQ